MRIIVTSLATLYLAEAICDAPKDTPKSVGLGLLHVAAFAPVLGMGPIQLEPRPQGMIEALGVGVPEHLGRMARAAILFARELELAAVGIAVAVLAARGCSAEGPRIGPLWVHVTSRALRFGVGSVEGETSFSMAFRIELVGCKCQARVALQAIGIRLGSLGELACVGIGVAGLAAVGWPPGEAIGEGRLDRPVAFRAVQIRVGLVQGETAGPVQQG